MSVKIILFGDSNCLDNSLAALRCAPFEEGEQIRVENIQAGLINYLLFLVKDMSLVVSQAAGTVGLICFFSEKSGPQIRDQLSSLVSKSKQVEGIPLVIAVNTSSKLISLRQIMFQLEQLKTKDRITLIKEVDFESKTSMESLLDWISSQRNQVGFDAQPRVVKAKPKYREQPEGDKLYESLMKDKKFKAMSSINQQAKYLALEKQRIKQINMQDQLAKFTKNKQKMTPYDIKPSPNPRIQPNLVFFLKDIHDDKPQEASIKIQTDQFKPRPPSPKYVPKKTGIDCSTQVEDNQLFDFDREVEPILNVLTIRTLEEAVLDIQEQEQIFKMTKYRELYQYKKKEQKNLHREYLLAEEQIIRQKQQMLKKRKARHESKLNCFRKVQAYKIAHQLNQKIYSNVIDSLSVMGFVPNQLHNQLHTDYLAHLMKESTQKLKQIESRTSELLNCFDEDCIKPLIQASAPRKQERKVKVEKFQKRRLNQSINSRVINLLFKSKPSLGQFVLNFDRHIDGTYDEYQKTYLEKLKEVEVKVTTGQIPQDSVQKFKQEELMALVKDKQGLLINENLKYGFVLSHNQYQPTEKNKRLISLKAIVLNQNSEITEEVSSSENSSIVFSHNQQLRDPKKKLNYDQSLQFQLSNLQNASAIIFIVKIHDLQSLSNPESSYLHAYSAFGLETSTYAVPIVQKQLKQFNIFEFYKKEQQKTEEQLETKSCWVIPFILTNNTKLKSWQLQTMNYITKPMTVEEQNNFKAEMIHYWKQCSLVEKDSEQQEEVQQIPKEKIKSSRQGKRDRRKSKDEQPPKKTVVVEESTQLEPPTVSRMLPQHIVDLQNDLFESLNQMLIDEVNLHPEIIKNYPHGWHIQIKGKPFESISQLRKFKKVGDLKIESNPEPIIESQRNEQSSIVENENENEQNAQ